jgi:hypothetical protein
VCDPYLILIVCRLSARRRRTGSCSPLAADPLRIFNFNFTEDLPIIAAAQNEVGRTCGR